MDQAFEQAVTTGKRKAASEAQTSPAHYHFPRTIVPPRFISCSKMMKTTSGARPRPITPWIDRPADNGLASLPRELFCNIVAFIGPTSSSLCALTQVSREHRSVMTLIGDVMLQRAMLRFRTPLPPKSRRESSISLFVRHARASKAVHDRLEELEKILKKDFPCVHSSLDDAAKLACEPTHRSDSDPYLDSVDYKVPVEPHEVNHALNVALCLLGSPKPHYFRDPTEAEEISKNAATTALEWRVSSLCSKIGARAYKYAKSRMCRSYEREDALFSSYYGVTDEMPSYDDSDEDEDYDDISIDPSEMEADQDMTILDKASLVMQHVVLKEQHNARRLNGQAATLEFAIRKTAGQGIPQHAYAET